MKYDKDISLIIPFKSDGGSRDKNWSWLQRRYIRLMPEAEILVGFDNSEPYCKSRSVNLAVERATRDILIIVDADIIFDPIQIEKAVEMLEHHTWVLPFINRIELSDKDTAELLQKCPCENIADLTFTNFTVAQPGVGSINIVTRKCFDLVKGFDERFKGWGAQDCAFEMSLDTLCGPRYTPPDSTVWHLYHPLPVTDTYQSPNYPANYELYIRYLEANGKQEKMKALIEEK